MRWGGVSRGGVAWGGLGLEVGAWRGRGSGPAVYSAAYNGRERASWAPPPHAPTPLTHGWPHPIPPHSSAVCSKQTVNGYICANSLNIKVTNDNATDLGTSIGAAVDAAIAAGGNLLSVSEAEAAMPMSWLKPALHWVNPACPPLSSQTHIALAYSLLCCRLAA